MVYYWLGGHLTMFLWLLTFYQKKIFPGKISIKMKLEKK